jgi:hypothetical protein
MNCDEFELKLNELCPLGEVVKQKTLLHNVNYI